LSKVGDPLEKLQQWIDFEEFRDPLEEALPSKSGSSKGGRPSMDCVMMFKTILLGKMYNVSDDQLEFLIADRLTFQRFLGLTLDDKVPDAKTIWVYRERLGENGTLEKLFAQLNEKITEAGWVTREGSLVDATFVEVPKQRNTREENATIKKGYRNKPLTAEAKETNREKSRVRARVAHVFGQMKMSLAGTFCRTIGMVRAKAHVVFKNIAYNSYGTPI
jgi:transposase